MPIVAVDRVAAHIIDDALLAERLCGRRIVAVIADQMHTDRQMVQARVEQGGEIEVMVLAGDEDIG